MYEMVFKVFNWDETEEILSSYKEVGLVLAYSFTEHGTVNARVGLFDENRSLTYAVSIMESIKDSLEANGAAGWLVTTRA